MAYVYKHIRKDTNDVFYIGIGQLENRVYSKVNRNKQWKKIVDDVGFIFEVIESDLTWSEACEKEKYWINYYGRLDLKKGNLVNLTDGGNGSKNRSNETVKKILESRKWYKHSEETKLKIGNSNKGKIGGRLGKRASDETKMKISESQKGKKVSDETRMKMSKSQKGKKLSDITKLKMGKLRSGKNNPSSIRCIDLKTNKIYDTIKEMSEDLEIPYHKLFYKIYYSNKNTRYKKL